MIDFISVRKSEKEMDTKCEYPHCPQLMNHLFIIKHKITTLKTLFPRKQHFFH